jgi:hypothetical protein
LSSAEDLQKEKEREEEWVRIIGSRRKSSKQGEEGRKARKAGEKDGWKHIKRGSHSQLKKGLRTGGSSSEDTWKRPRDDAKQSEWE